MTNLHQVTADTLIALCNLGKMDNSLHQTIWSKLDSYTDLLDLGEICTALSVAANTHGTPGCRSYIHNILKLNVGLCLKPLLKAGKIQQFDILVEHMSYEHAIDVFECAIEQEYWKGALFILVHQMEIEDWTDHEKCFAVGNQTGRTLKHINCVKVSHYPRLDLIAELERRALKTALEECVDSSVPSPRRKI